jgi:Protein of unknown function (DUF2924)
LLDVAFISVWLVQPNGVKRLARRSNRVEFGALRANPPNSASGDGVAALLAGLPDLDQKQLCLRWRNHLGGSVPAHLPRWLLTRVLGYRLQAAAHGDLDAATLRKIRGSPSEAAGASLCRFARRAAATREGTPLRPGVLIVREWKGDLQRVTILNEGFAWNGATFGSLSQVAKAITGVNWNGHRFFGLRKAGEGLPRPAIDAQ